MSRWGKRGTVLWPSHAPFGERSRPTRVDFWQPFPPATQIVLPPTTELLTSDRCPGFSPKMRRARKSRCSQICSCRLPPNSTRLHKLQQDGLNCLKRKYLKTITMPKSLKSALGTVRSFFVFMDLEGGHLSKQQVVGAGKPSGRASP